MYGKLEEKDRQIIELDFSKTPEMLQGEYLNTYDGVRSEVSHKTKFDENSDLSKTYLDRIDMTRSENK